MLRWSLGNRLKGVYYPRVLCGRRVSDAVQAFVQGLLPTTQEWCTLDVIRRNGLLLSNDNRRLHAMKEAQRQLRKQDPAAVLWVNVRIYTWEPAAKGAVAAALDGR